MTGDIKVQRLWTCRKCGATEYGDPCTVALRQTGEPWLAIHRHFRHAPRTDFPVGWADYGNDGAECPDCH